MSLAKNERNESREFARELERQTEELLLQRELIKCLQERIKELETAETNEYEYDGDMQSPSRAIGEAFNSIFGRFGLTTSSEAIEDERARGKEEQFLSKEVVTRKKDRRGDFDDDDDDDDALERENEVRGYKKDSIVTEEQERIINVLVNENVCVPGIVSVRNKRLVFGVVDCDIDKKMFVGLRKVSREERERILKTNGGGGESGSIRKRTTQTNNMHHLKTLAQYLNPSSKASSSASVGDNKDESASLNDDVNDSSSSSLEMYEILWKEDGEIKRLVFEANADGFMHVSKRVQTWSEEAKNEVRAMPDNHNNNNNNNNNADKREATTTTATSSIIIEREKESTRKILKPMEKSSASQQPELIGYALKNAPIIDQTIQSCLISALPSRFRRSAWTLKYSSKRDGISLHSLYRAVRQSPATVLAVRDTNGFCFGAFSTEVWSTQNANRYFGTGESFVYSIEKDGDNTVTAFTWSGKNDYFQIAKSESLGVGGGSNYALWIDEDFTRGISGSYCETYESECIASAEEFEVLNVEIYEIS